MPNIYDIDNGKVVGFKKESKIIIDQLIRGSKEREVVLITGMGGLGKTTLARRVYEEKNVVNHFDKRAWCTVSQEYDCKDLLEKIYNEVCGHKIKNDGNVAEALSKSLKGRRYLIVLDDIWSLEAWEELNRVFPACDNGSRIVITSRQESVVSDAKAICLPLFTTGESWELLQEKLFKGNRCPEELKNVGREISKKCGGLPLVVGLIAGLLEKVEKSEQMWREFLHTLNSDISYRDGIQSKDAIELSYKHLSHHLKPCLLYFAAFPEDKAIGVAKLIELWISEGFIGMIEKGRVEDVAEDYLNHLVRSNLIMVYHREYDGRITDCIVHDLVHDFCLTKVKEENFLEVIDMKRNELGPRLNLNGHGICFHRQWDSDVPFESLPRNSSINTVLMFKNYCKSSDFVLWIVKKFEHLTILDLEDMSVDQSILSEVNSLIHLRYLALSVVGRNKYTDVSSLSRGKPARFVVGGDKYVDVSPLSLGKLECLVTLKLNSRHLNLPIFFLNIRRLRHMIINNFDNYDMEKSYGPGSIVVEYEKTIETSSVVIEEVRYSEDLQTWVSPCALTTMHQHLLRKFPYLKKLSCGVSEYPFPEIDFLHHLESLHLQLKCFECVPRVFLELNKFPSSLKKIYLDHITLSESVFSLIGQLPNLEYLRLKACILMGSNWNGQFCKLKYLQIEDYTLFGLWNVSDESFPCLEELHLEGCPLLQEVPSRFGDISTLKLISVRGCSSKVNSLVKKFEEDARDLGNEQLKVTILEPSWRYFPK